MPAQPRADGQRAGQRHGRHARLLRAGQPDRAGPAVPHGAAQRGPSVVRRPGDPGHGGPHPAAEPGAAGRAARAGWRGLRRRSSPCRWCSASACGSWARRRRTPRSGRSTCCARWRAPWASSGSPRTPGTPTRRPRSASAEVIRRRREEIAAGAEADRPDVISQILLAGADGHARRGRAGRAGPPGPVRVHRRARRAAHQLHRGAGQVPRPAELPARQPRDGQELRRGDAALRRSGEEPVPPDHRRGHHRAGSPSPPTPGSWCSWARPTTTSASSPGPRRSTCSAPSPPTTRSSPSARASTPAWARPSPG